MIEEREKAKPAARNSLTAGRCSPKIIIYKIGLKYNSFAKENNICRQLLPVANGIGLCCVRN